MTFAFTPPVRAAAPLLAALLWAPLLGGCGDDLCQDAQVVCDAAGSDLTFEGDCPDEPTECIASCVVDANDCTAEALAQCDEICAPFVEDE